MKKLIASIVFVIMAMGSSYGQEIKFETLSIDYGTIEKGSDPVREFIFKNTGSAPLVISNAQGSCGCTVPTYPKEPIMPGEKSKISVKYDTNRVGAFTKNVTLTTNCPNPTTVLTIRGDVIPKKTDESVPSNGVFQN